MLPIEYGIWLSAICETASKGLSLSALFHRHRPKKQYGGKNNEQQQTSRSNQGT